MAIRHLTTIDDVSNKEILMMFDAADVMSEKIEKIKSKGHESLLDICAGYNMASLFLSQARARGCPLSQQ